MSRADQPSLDQALTEAAHALDRADELLTDPAVAPSDTGRRLARICVLRAASVINATQPAPGTPTPGTLGALVETTRSSKPRTPGRVARGLRWGAARRPRGLPSR